MPLAPPVMPLRVVSPLVVGASADGAALVSVRTVVSRIAPAVVSRMAPVVLGDVIGVVLGVVVAGVVRRVGIRLLGSSFVTRVGTTSPPALPVVRGVRVVSLPVRGVPVVGCCADAAPAAPATSASASAAALHGVRRTCIVSS
jgi:hypothetical protein